MVNSRIEFNKKYSDKESRKEIKIETEDFDEEEQLDIEDYLNLEKLYLYDIQEIGRIALKNLPQLKECTIWDCGVQDLSIENCPQIRKLNIRQNNLTSLEFLKYLDNLENLEIDGNAKIISGLEYLPGNWGKFSYESTKLTEVLKLYGNDWKACKKDAQEIFNLLVKQDFQGLVKKFWDLKKSREELKKNIADITSKETQQKITSKAIITKIITKELVLNLSQEFQEKEKKINYLTLRSQELVEVSKEQKNKIISTFSRLLPEKELVQKLITTHFEFTRFKKQAIDSEDYEEKYDEYTSAIQETKKQLRSKLSKEIVKDTMNKIQGILTDCEKLAEQELELEAKLTNKSVLIAQQEKSILSGKEREIIAQNNEMQQKQLEGLELLRKQSSSILQELKEIKTFTQPQASFIEKLLNQLETESNLTPTEQDKILKKLNELLGIKRMFLKARQETIASLRQCCDILEEANIGKYAKREEISRALSTTGKLVGKWTVINIVEPVGEGMSIANSRNKRKFTIKSSDIFQSLLTEEEKNLQLFKEVYDLLLNSPSNLTIEKEQEPSLFSLRYRIYDIATNIWQNKAHVETSDMKDAIASLQINLLNLQDELKSQELLLTNLQKQQLQAQIQILPQS